MRLNRKLLRILSTGIMLILGFFFLYPLLWMLSSSLKLPAAVFEYPMRWIPETLRFSNYATVWSHPGAPFYLFYINSIMVAFGSIAGTLVLCSTAAYAFARINFKGKNAVFLLLMSTMMIPKQVTLIPRFAMFNAMGLFNTLWALILPSHLLCGWHLPAPAVLPLHPRRAERSGDDRRSHTRPRLYADHAAADKVRRRVARHIEIRHELERVYGPADFPD